LLTHGAQWEHRPTETLCLFLSTLQTDRNLILTVIPDGVTQGLPKQQDGASNIMHAYINGIDSYVEQVSAFTDPAGSPPRNILRITDQSITRSPGRPLRLGIFRDVRPDLDYQFLGRMCGVRIYDRALSARQVLDDYRFDICNAVVKPKIETKEFKELEKKTEVKEIEKKLEIKEFKEKELKEGKDFEKLPKEKSEQELVKNPGVDFGALHRSRSSRRYHSPTRSVGTITFLSKRWRRRSCSAMVEGSRVIESGV